MKFQGQVPSLLLAMALSVHGQETMAPSDTMITMNMTGMMMNMTEMPTETLAPSNGITVEGEVVVEDDQTVPPTMAQTEVVTMAMTEMVEEVVTDPTMVVTDPTVDVEPDLDTTLDLGENVTLGGNVTVEEEIIILNITEAPSEEMEATDPIATDGAVFVEATEAPTEGDMVMTDPTMTEPTMTEPMPEPTEMIPGDLIMNMTNMTVMDNETLVEEEVLVVEDDVLVVEDDVEADVNETAVGAMGNPTPGPTNDPGSCATVLDNTDAKCAEYLEGTTAECDCYNFCSGKHIGCIPFGQRSSFSCSGETVAGCVISQKLAIASGASSRSATAVVVALVAVMLV